MYHVTATCCYQAETRHRSLLGSPDSAKEHDLSWLDWGAIRDLSPDGRTLIFSHFGEKSGKNYSVYLRKTDNPAAVRLGEGSGWALSPDEMWVISILVDTPQVYL